MNNNYIIIILSLLIFTDTIYSVTLENCGNIEDVEDSYLNTLFRINIEGDMIQVSCRDYIMMNQVSDITYTTGNECEAYGDKFFDTEIDGLDCNPRLSVCRKYNIYVVSRKCIDTDKKYSELATEYVLNSSTLSPNIITLSSTLSPNITTLSSTLPPNITTLNSTLSPNITTLNSVGNVKNFEIPAPNLIYIIIIIACCLLVIASFIISTTVLTIIIYNIIKK